MPEAWEAMVTVGRVARTHGLRGQVVVNPESDFPEDRFREGGVVYARREGVPVPLTIGAVRFQRGRPILTFTTLASIDDASWLASRELRVPAGALRALPTGRFYQHDLLGCEVRTRQGDPVGQVVDVEGSADASRLVLRRDGQELLVPLADEICVEIDTGRRRIVIDPPEGLLDLNATGRGGGEG